MTAESFIANLKEILVDGSPVLDVVRSPAVGDDDPLEPYRAWYRALPPADQTMVEGFLQYAERLTIFNVLAVIDGVFPVFEDQTGEFKLLYIEDGDSDILTADEEPFLHDIFRAMVEL